MRITIKRKDVVQDLVKYSKYNSFVWKIPKEIFHGQTKLKIAFLRGLFDGDGNFSIVRKNEIRARIYSVNIRELRKVHQIVNSFEIQNKIYGPYFSTKSKTGIYMLTITGKNAISFIKLIKPTKI
jgi:intein/homing endonuclease